jgi:hypothetical protein
LVGGAFEQSVFINCPFDDDFEPILQAVLFCIVDLGLTPRLAKERNDSGEVRLHKIADLIRDSKFSIHDLSRSQASEAGEFFRLNMPFEYGVDWACRRWFGEGRAEKKFLVLDEKRYRYQAALSDIAGSDIQYHHGDYQKAVRKVRNWLVSEAGIDAPGATRILARYADFQGWHYEKQLAAGFSEADIEDYPTPEFLGSMLEWKALGEPITYNPIV